MSTTAVQSSDPVTADLSGSACADDLLSEMAGEELNRLLADAELEPVSPITRPATPTATEISTEAGDLTSAAATADRELDDALSQQTTDAAQSPASVTLDRAVPDTNADHATPDAPATVADTLSADGVSDLLGSLSIGDPSPGEIDEPSEAGVTANRGAEPTALIEPPTESEAEPEPAASKPVGSVLMGRLLDWITYPLDPFPDTVREAIGKVAVVTAINAIGLLIYVAFMR